jgi:transposase
MARSVIEGGLSKAAAAHQFNTTPNTVARWVDRFRADGVAGLQDRSSRPRSSPSQAAPAICARVEALRRQRHTGEPIAAEVGVSAATVSGILKRLGLNRLSALEPPEPVRRYQRSAPGEIIHIDIKKLASSIGSVTGSPATGPAKATPAGSDGSCASGDRRPFAPGLFRNPAGRKKRLCLRFLFNALRFFRSLGVKVERAMTDNGASFRSLATPRPCACSRSSICAPNPTRPKPTARPGASSRQACSNGLMPGLTAPLKNGPPNCPLWLHRYNWHPRHGGIGSKPPISRRGLTGDNVLRLHS